MNKRNIVKQNYKLVNGKYKLNASEMKFVLSALSQIKIEDREFCIYSISVSELETKLQAEQNETRLKQFAKRLMSKPFEVETERGWAYFHWFSKLEYIRGESRFEVRIDNDLKPYLLELKERFVKFNLQYILPLSSNYSIRIYQLLKEYEKLTKRTFTVDELQDLLQVPKSLKIYNRFKEKVLKVAERELIENCDIFFEYEEIKTNRKVTEILFRIKDNKRFLKAKEPRLFEAESEYIDYIGQKMNTTEGEQTIKLITPFSDFIKINFESGYTAKITNMHEVKSNLV